MSRPKPPPRNPRLAADNNGAARLAEALDALAGVGWPHYRYGIAVSGGADSMALLAMMAELVPGHVWAATVDHRLRQASADEAAMVARWCAAASIPHAILIPAQPIAGSVQAAARMVRYALLDDWQNREGLAFVLTAHHADDQLETMIMRLNRASGVGGLAGIRAQQGKLLRPLLGWRRAELEQFVAARGIDFIDDPSNADPRFDRARLRGALAGQRFIDADAAARSAQWLDEADRALEWMVDKAITDWPDAADPDIICDRHYPAELFRRIVSRRLRSQQPGLTLRGVALDGVIRAMRAGRRAMVGQLLIDPAPADGRSVWRISVAPRRKTLQK